METLASLEAAGWLRTSHPFLQPDTVEATYGFHPQLALEHGDRSVQRAAFNDVLPPVVRNRRTKAEFSATGWETLERSNGIDRLLEGPLCSLGLLDIDDVEQRVAAATNRQGSVRPLSRLVNADRWLRSLGH